MITLVILINFYISSDRKDSQNRMEIDFLLAKSKTTSRHNISALEVKSGKNYTLSSLNKLNELKPNV